MTDGIQIERSQHAQEFVIIGNSEARDGRLSFRARGLHHHLLSLPPGWRVTTVQLAADNPEGRDAIRTALSELIAHRYVTKVKRQDERGHWSTVITVHDLPQPETDSQAPAAEDGFPGVGNPGVGGSGAKQKTVTKDVKERSKNLASRHARAKSSASTNLTVVDAVNAVREAVVRVHGTAEAEEISDDDAFGLFQTYVGNRRPRSLVTYLAKIFGDGPYIDTFLSNSSPCCTRCQQWEPSCKCQAA